MTDHGKLREALGHVHDYFADPSQCIMDKHLTGDDLRALRAAAESTLPKTRMVECWHVEHVYPFDKSLHVDVCTSRELAEAKAAHRRDQELLCIRVTGPHQQEVPA